MQNPPDNSGRAFGIPQPRYSGGQPPDNVIVMEEALVLERWPPPMVSKDEQVGKWIRNQESFNHVGDDIHMVETSGFDMNAPDDASGVVQPIGSIELTDGKGTSMETDSMESGPIGNNGKPTFRDMVTEGHINMQKPKFIGNLDVEVDDDDVMLCGQESLLKII
ncbi:hypothetical protein V6N13_009258 [Hibiscus sabdariffa]|uniref:Uncharacterized protein n=2 Tax=Hibiscus sabdariffa TaxID=183260 RepID=A0ABR2DHN6_9ROSI